VPYRAYPMNGGAWLTAEGQKVDVLYRDLDVHLALGYGERNGAAGGLWHFVRGHTHPPKGVLGRWRLFSANSSRLLPSRQSILPSMRS
jgi:hypothetical protein